MPPIPCNQMGQSANIAGAVFIGPYAAYVGNYSTNNNLNSPTYSYYLGGDSTRTDVPHFTVPTTGNPRNPVAPGTGMFTSFHITVYANGSNAGVWYNRTPAGGIGPPQINWNNVPPSRQPEINAQLPVLNVMAQQFWNQLGQ
jgi:hypothetical protein